MGALNLDVRTSVDAASWEGILRRLGSNVFHSSEWAAYTSFARPNAIPHYFSLNDSGGSVCAALGFVSRSRFNILRSLWFDALPAVAGSSDGLLSEFFVMVERWARDNGIHVFSIGSYGYEQGIESLIRQEYALEKRFEFSITLTDRSIENIWSRMDRRRRNNVKAAEEKEVTAGECSSEEGVKTLRCLQAESSERIVQRGGEKIARSYPSGKDPFLILINRGVARLFIASLGDRPLSARLCSSYNGLVYCISGGHTHDGLKYNSGTLLHWELIKRFKEEGAREYNLGGSKYEARDEKSPEHGVYVYKKYFGAECRECANGMKILRPISYSLVKTLARIIE
jgi:hypothetical protein